MSADAAPVPPDVLRALLDLAKFLQSRHRELGELACIGVLPVIPLLLAGLHARRTDTRVHRLALRAAVAMVLLYAGVYTAIIASNVVHPQDWDLVAYWLYGFVAAHGVNFYDPEHYRRLSAGIATSPEIVAFVVDVGFNLPPPSIFLVLPLGWFSLHAASALWYVPLVATAAYDVTLLTRLFVGRSRAATLFVAAFVLALRPAMATAWFGQTNFLVLLLLLLFWRDRDTLRAGVWFGLGMLVKPVFATLGLYVLIARRWRVAAGAAGVLAALSLVTIAVFGWDTFATYFVNGPVTRTPFGAYTEDINQSLLAVILRATHAADPGGSPVMHPLFVAVGLTLAAITTWRVYRAHRAGDDELAIALIVPLGLLLYPGTLAHYSVDLLLPLFLVWRRREHVFGGPLGAGAFIALEYALINADTSLAIAANATAWAGLVALRPLSPAGELRDS